MTRMPAVAIGRRNFVMPRRHSKRRRQRPLGKVRILLHFPKKLLRWKRRSLSTEPAESACTK